MTTTSFRDAYTVLQQHAETLRNQREPDIDNLLTIVTQSVEAYKVCKERIDAVEKALAQALNGANTDISRKETSSGEDNWLDEPRDSAPGQQNAGFNEDDVPF
ncbi:exodeoxyribonuclease VII small subunit [Thauera humireducens]|uniref:exodeoxyribonuclease VII small subunit n=1 Tax=Thauera humireducens TaxID=1134435 RepID=UPI003120372F